MNGGDALVYVATMALGGAAGYFLAGYKGRPAKAVPWTVIGVLLPIMVPLLAVWRRVPGTPKPHPAPTIIFATLASGIVALGLVSAVVQWDRFGGQSLPTCASGAVKDTAVAAVAGAPMVEFGGLKLLDLYKTEQVSSTENERHCMAIGMFSNGAESQLKLRVFQREGSNNYFVLVQQAQ